MVVEAARKLVDSVDVKMSQQELGLPFLGDGYVAAPIEEQNFHPFPSVGSPRRTAFVDGGNHEILSAPTFSMQVNSVYFNVFEGDRRVKETGIPRKVEFLSATVSSFRHGEVFFDTLLFPVQEEFSRYLPSEEDLSFNSMDLEVRMGRNRASISKVASIARRFAEWSFTEKVVEEELDAGDVVVRDGTLQAAFDRETSYIDSCLEASKKKQATFTGLSKTSRIYTNTGLSLLGAVQQLAEERDVEYPTWYYHPVAEVASKEWMRRHRAEIFLVKLNPDAQRVFRFEIFKDQARELLREGVEELLSSLAANSRDIGFAGYPYGLLDADVNARVSQQDAKTYRAMVLSEISRQGKWENFARHIRASDAHQVLDTLRGIRT